MSDIEEKIKKRSFEIIKGILPQLVKESLPATPYSYLKCYESNETEKDRKERDEYETETKQAVIRQTNLQELMDRYILSVLKDDNDQDLKHFYKQIREAKNIETLFERTSTILQTVMQVSTTQSILDDTKENNTTVQQFTAGIGQEMTEAHTEIQQGIQDNKIDKTIGDNIGKHVVVAMEKNKRFEEFYKKKARELENKLQEERKDFKKSLDSIKEKLEATERLTNYDALTKVFNRRAFDQKLYAEVSRGIKGKSNCALALVDIDFFKKVNDTHGHQIGDITLQYLAKIAPQCIRATDFFARYGGEEFAIIFPNTSYQNAKLIAEKFRKRIDTESFTVKGTPLSITISIGLSEIQEHKIENISDLIDVADKALYQAKETGRNKVC